MASHPTTVLSHPDELEALELRGVSIVAINGVLKECLHASTYARDTAAAALFSTEQLGRVFGQLLSQVLPKRRF